MSEQVLKNKNGSTIGKITTDSYGVQTICNARGERLGSYHPGLNVTRNKNGANVGYGNLLTTLL